MKKNMLIFFVHVILFVQISKAQENYKELNTKEKYTLDKSYDVQCYAYSSIRFKKKPKNIILFIGDGMGVNHVFATLSANRGMLNLKNMKYIGFSQTQSANKYTTDSAAGGTAISAGFKTNNGSIGINAEGDSIPTILEIAEANGLATGLISTSAITHATPASFIAHESSRQMYEAIAADFLNTDIDLFIGGGYSFFTQRKDDRNLFDELQDKGYFVSQDLEDLKPPYNKSAILLADTHLPKYIERGDMLTNSTKKATEMLSKDKDGFFLMIEGSQIDWGGHQNDITYIINETIDLDKAVGEALKFAVNDKNTLVIVTADHETGGVSIDKGDMKSGRIEVDFAKKGHTGVMVPVFAFGPGAEEFIGIYENTDLFKKMIKLYGFKK